jgi:hypothetical protein
MLRTVATLTSSGGYKSYKNFRGIYDSTTQYRESEKSQVFIRITKTKVLAAYGQIIDILFANKKFPLVVESTPVPEGIAEFAHMETPLDQMQPQDPYGFAGDGQGACSRCPTGRGVQSLSRRLTGRIRAVAAGRGSSQDR